MKHLLVRLTVARVDLQGPYRLLRHVAGRVWASPRLRADADIAEWTSMVLYKSTARR